MFRNTIKGLMIDIGYYSIHKGEMKHIESMNISQLIRYCLFCFGMASVGIIFLVNQGVIRFGYL